MDILILSLSIVFVMLVWFRTNSIPEYADLFGLRKLFLLDAFDKDENKGVWYADFLYSCYSRFFWMRLIHCPVCLSFWLSLVSCWYLQFAFINVLAVAGLVNLIYYWTAAAIRGSGH